MEKLPPFSLADELEPKTSPAPEKIPDLPLIKNAVADLHANEVTDPLPTSDGAVVGRDALMAIVVSLVVAGCSGSGSERTVVATASQCTGFPT